MPRVSQIPMCRLGHVSRRGSAPTAVWICEYPYRTMRLSGPSSDCGDCPVWRQMQREQRASDLRRDEIRFLETLMSTSSN